MGSLSTPFWGSTLYWEIIPRKTADSVFQQLSWKETLLCFDGKRNMILDISKAQTNQTRTTVLATTRGRICYVHVQSWPKDCTLLLQLCFYVTLKNSSKHNKVLKDFYWQINQIHAKCLHFQCWTYSQLPHFTLEVLTHSFLSCLCLMLITFGLLLGICV